MQRRRDGVESGRVEPVSLSSAIRWPAVSMPRQRSISAPSAPACPAICKRMAAATGAVGSMPRTRSRPLGTATIQRSAMSRRSALAPSGSAGISTGVDRNQGRWAAGTIPKYLYSAYTSVVSQVLPVLPGPTNTVNGRNSTDARAMGPKSVTSSVNGVWAVAGARALLRLTDCREEDGARRIVKSLSNGCSCRWRSRCPSHRQELVGGCS